MRRRAVLTGLLATSLTQRASGAQATASARGRVSLRVCLDTSPNHLRNISMAGFAQRLEQLQPGVFTVRIFDSGQLYSDRDAMKALLWGDIDMALPTVLQVARIESVANLSTLPMFYGLPRAALQDTLDGRIAPMIAARMQQRLPVQVLTPNLDLGYVQIFATTRPLHAIDDIAAMKIRVPGGTGNLLRLRLQRAYPVSIPWSDVPLSLSQGNIDAVASTYETVQSATLWDVGVRFALEDRGMFVQYLPVVRRGFWTSLDVLAQQALVRAWRETAVAGRAFAAERQNLAMAAAQQHGIAIARPADTALALERNRLIKSQASIARSLGITAHDVDALRRVLAQGS